HLGLDRAETVQPCAVLDPCNRIVVRPRGDLPTFVAKASDLPIPLGANTDAVAGFRAIRLDRKSLIACRDQFHWSPELLRRKRHERRAWGYLPLRSERPADKRADHADALGLDAEPSRDASLQAMHELAWLVNCQLAILPNAGRRKQFDG